MNANLGYLYAKREELLEKKEKYTAALGIAEEIGDKLFQCGNKLSTIKDNLHSYFTVSGMTADGGKVEMLISSVGEIHSFFTGNLTSQIDTELTLLTNQIVNCDNEISVELAKQKEEGAK